MFKTAVRPSKFPKFETILTMRHTNDESPNFTRETEYDFGIRQPGKTQGTQSRTQDLSWDIIALYQHYDLKHFTVEMI